MKKLTTMISVLFLGSAIAMAGCKKDDKDAGKKDDKGAKKDTEKKDEMKKDEPKKDEGGGGGEAAGGGGTGLPDCDAYITAVENYVKCDKVPQQARDGVKQGLDSMKQGWGNMAGVPDDVKKQTNDACKQAVDGLKQGASAMGCTI